MDIDVFASELGWVSILGEGGRLQRVQFGFGTERAAWEAIERTGVSGDRARRWEPTLRRRLRDFARGLPQDFSDTDLALDSYRGFAQEVLLACRAIPWGETRTYGELAAECGAPGAARAVGNVMASNRFPLVVPCHRVVAANGRLGGFSAPQGIEMKRRLLQLEISPAPLALVG